MSILSRLNIFVTTRSLTVLISPRQSPIGAAPEKSGRTHARTRVLVLVQDLDIRIINAATGELIRQLTLDPTKDYQPRGLPCGRPKKNPNPKRGFGAIPMS